MPIVEDLLVDFVEKGYLNDEQWAASFIRVQKGRKVGPRVIREKLKQKGIALDLIENLMEESIDEEADRESLQSLLDRKLKNANPKDPKARQKVIAFLLRRGFDYEKIQELMHAKAYEGA